MNTTEKKSILVVGLYFSGSSALTDFFKEFSDIEQIPGEFNDFRRRGYIGDMVSQKAYGGGFENRLESLVEKLRSDSRTHGGMLTRAAKEIYLYFDKSKKEFISKKLSPRVERWYERIGHRKQTLRLRANLLEDLIKILDVRNTNGQIVAARDYVRKVKRHCTDKEIVLLDQPIILSKHNQIWQQVFDPYRLFIVYRDPRDQLAEIIQSRSANERFNPHIIHIYGEGRKGLLEWMIDSLASQIEICKEIVRKDKNAYLVSFEEFVKQHEAIKKDILENSPLNESKHINKRKYFNPDISKNNVGVYKNKLTPYEIRRIQRRIKLDGLDCLSIGAKDKTSIRPK